MSTSFIYTSFTIHTTHLLLSKRDLEQLINIYKQICGDVEPSSCSGISRCLSTMF